MNSARAQEWYSAAELADLKLPGIRTSPRGVRMQAQQWGWHHRTSLCRARDGNGGGIEYHVQILPDEAQAALYVRQQREAAVPEPSARQVRREAGWDRLDRVSGRLKDKAYTRAEAVRAVERLEAAAATRTEAVAAVAAEIGVSTSTLWNWLRSASLVDRGDAPAVLVPHYAGRTATAACDPRGWDYFRADYLRPEKPAFSAVYRRLQEAAEKNGWAPIPSLKTLQRRLEREVPRPVIVMAREGEEAARQLYPAQVRDRSVFHALEEVNADGHTFDVFVRWEDGTVGRPVLVGFQDLYSGRILAHRIDGSENRDVVRLAVADLVESWGIPEHIYLDNGRAFASKMITGRMRTRYRFKVREDEPAGILKSLQATVHWVRPRSGQSKPIERAWKDLCEEISRHPFCAGAYTGNDPLAKPENYGKRAIDIEAFREHVAAQIARHNARPGRRTAVCQGRSFAETFDESYRTALIRQATAAQRHGLLLAGEGVTVNQRGQIMLADNRYWDEALAGWIGRKVIVKFDPQSLQSPVHIYTLDDQFICSAECIAATGFNDAAAARAHAAKKKAWLKAQREVLRLQQVLSVEDIARMLPGAPEEEAPERRVVRPVFGSAAPKLDPAHQPLSDADYDAAMEAVGRSLREREAATVLPFGGGADD